jgi:mono/diheme cytochrome c family protein
MTRQPLQVANRENALAFPFGIRPLIAVWKLLYLQRGEFRPDPGKSEQQNRGAYLVEGLAHCGACHTPRNAFGAEKHDAFLAGGESESWHAPALNAGSPAPVRWTLAQLTTYLRKGFVEPHGVAAGPMRDVVNNLGSADERDVQAIAAYVGSSLVPATAERPERRSTPAPAAADAGSSPAVADTTGSDGSGLNAGATLYAGACAACHQLAEQRFAARGIPLADSKVIAMDDPRNLIHIIIEGIVAPAATPGATMPGFDASFTDRQIAELAAFLRARLGGKPPWSDVEARVRDIRHAQP